MFTPFDASGVRHAHVAAIVGDASETVLSRGDFKGAISEITAWDDYTPTPLYALTQLAGALGLKDVFYKDEAPRFGLSSFKALGGAYAACCLLQREIGRKAGHSITLSDIRDGRCRELAAKVTLVSATDGNHGRSLAWGAQRFGAACRIYIHREVTERRAEAMRALGAKVVRIDGNYDNSVRIAREDAKANGWLIVSDTSWEGYSKPPQDVMAGYGVILHEISDALSEVPTHVFLQGGVGGLAAAACASLRQKWGALSPRVVVVEPELAACLFASANAGRASAVKITQETIMAGLSCGVPSPLAWRILREEASDYITIPDRLVAPTMRILGRPLAPDPVIVAGESAVAGLAAVIAVALCRDLRDACGLDADSRVLVIGTEGATDPDIYDRIMNG